MPKWCAVDDETGFPFALIDELYQEYSEWAKLNGFLPLNMIHFSRRVKKIYRARKKRFCDQDFRRMKIGGRRRKVIVHVARCV